MLIKCEVCGVSFNKAPSKVHVDKHHYCCRECCTTGRSKKLDVVCDHCGNTFKKKLAETEKSNQHFCSMSCRDLELVGENHHNWRGGITTENRRDRCSSEYKSWRCSVFERDEFTCQKCGTSGDLNAHHILSFSLFPSARLKISNGVALCINCHKEFHSTYTKYSFTEDDYMEWINDGV